MASGKQAKLIEMFEPAIEALGCDLWGIDYHAQGKESVLRIYIEKNDGVMMEDCERVSRQVSSILDVEDPISGEYTLEVSSPGMDRSLFKLDQYRLYFGQHVNIRLRVAFDGRKNFSGTLKAVEEDEIVLEVDNEEYLLPFELIDKANLVPQL